MGVCVCVTTIYLAQILIGDNTPTDGEDWTSLGGRYVQRKKQIVSTDDDDDF